jgi:hypothetical protein
LNVTRTNSSFEWPGFWGAGQLHLGGIELEELFKPLGVVAEGATDIHRLQEIIVFAMKGAQCVGHFFRIVEFRDCLRKMRVTAFEYPASRRRKLQSLLIREFRHWESIVDNSNGISKSVSNTTADRGQPKPV